MPRLDLSPRDLRLALDLIERRAFNVAVERSAADPTAAAGLLGVAPAPARREASTAA